MIEISVEWGDWFGCVEWKWLNGKCPLNLLLVSVVWCRQCTRKVHRGHRKCGRIDQSYFDTSSVWTKWQRETEREFVICMQRGRTDLTEDTKKNLDTWNLSKVYLHSNAAAFVSWALGCWVAAVIVGCVIAAKAAKFCIFMGGKRLAAAAAAADSAVCVFSPVSKLREMRGINATFSLRLGMHCWQSSAF